jgi:adenylate cyclase
LQTNISLTLYRGSTEVFSSETSTPLLIGRQEESESIELGLVTRTQRQPGEDLPLNKLVVTGKSAIQSIPRVWFVISRMQGKELQVINRHPKRGVLETYPAEEIIPQRKQYRLHDHLEFELDRDAKLRLVISLPSTIASSTMGPLMTGSSDSYPGDQSSASGLMSACATGQSGMVTLRQLRQSDAGGALRLLNDALEVVKLAPGHPDQSFGKAVQYATEVLELDRAFIFTRPQPESSTWVPRAGHAKIERLLHEPWSHSFIDEVAKAAMTRTLDVRPTELTQSQRCLVSAIGAPIIVDDQVAGVLYGDCLQSPQRYVAGKFDETDKPFLEVLASALAAGMAKHKETMGKEILAAFLTKDLADQIVRDPAILEGREAEITALSCDIRGFSRTTQRLGPKATVEWLNDMLSELSQCVLDEDGVLVDYAGDSLLAMWGAHGQSHDHAARAIRSAQAMLRIVPKINEKWRDRLAVGLGVSIGVNTGKAYVGNTGSRQKPKYGALGDVVNGCSRLEGATKYMRVNCLAAESTVQAAGFTHGRRLSPVTVVGMDHAVRIYEIVDLPANDREWKRLCADFEAVLQDFEEGSHRESVRRLGQMLSNNSNDGPSLMLLQRAVTALANPGDVFDPIYHLPTK